MKPPFGEGRISYEIRIPLDENSPILQNQMSQSEFIEGSKITETPR